LARYAVDYVSIRLFCQASRVAFYAACVIGTQSSFIVLLHVMFCFSSFVIKFYFCRTIKPRPNQQQCCFDNVASTLLLVWTGL